MELSSAYSVEGLWMKKGFDPGRNMLSPIVGPTFQHLAPHTHPANCQIVSKIPEGKLVFQAKNIFKNALPTTINQSISFFFCSVETPSTC